MKVDDETTDGRNKHLDADEPMANDDELIAIDGKYNDDEDDRTTVVGEDQTDDVAHVRSTT